MYCVLFLQTCLCFNRRQFYILIIVFLVLFRFWGIAVILLIVTFGSTRINSNFIKEKNWLRPYVRSLQICKLCHLV